MLGALWAQRVAVGWLVWRTTRSPTFVALAIGCELAPTLLIGPMIGVALDRWDRKWTVQVGQLLMSAAASLLAVATYLQVATIGLIVMVTLLGGSAGAVVLAGRLALVTEVARGPNAERATAWVAITGQVAALGGPALIGAILADGTEWQALVSVAAGLALAFLLLGVVCLLPEPAHLPTANLGLAWRDTARVITTQQPLLAFVLGLFLVVVIAGRGVTDLLPGFVEQVLGGDAAIFSWLVAAIAVGSLIAMGLMLVLARLQPLRLMWLSVLLLLAALGALASAPSLPWAAPVLAVLGAGLSLNSTAAQIYLQKESPRDARGRLMALYTMIWRGAPLLGILFMGLVSQTMGYDALPAAAMVLTMAGSGSIALALPRVQRRFSEPLG